MVLMHDGIGKYGVRGMVGKSDESDDECWRMGQTLAYRVEV